MIKPKAKAKLRVKTTKRSSQAAAKAAAAKTAEPSSQSEDEEAANEDEDAQEHGAEPYNDLPSDAELSAGENGEEEGRKGSMAAAMQRILHQSTSAKAPILAKRKTSLMRLHEEEAQRSKETAKARLEKKRRREAQMVIPDASTMIFEKQLRKIATKGVITLFNAIAQQRAQQPQALDKKNRKKRESKEAATKPPENQDFLQLLKDAAQHTTDDEKEAPSKKAKRQEPAGRSNDAAPKKWKVLDDNLATKGGLSLQDWDKNDDDDDDGNSSDGSLGLGDL